MDDYLSIFRALNRSNKYNTFCDTLSLEEKCQYEKVHNKFCKSVLGLKKTASNIAAKSKLGRFPLDSFIKIQVMMYFTRINLSDINPLVKEAFNINKDLHDNGMYSWYTFATKIFEEFNFDFTEYENFNSPFYKIKNNLTKKRKEVVSENYTSKVQEKLSKITDSSELYLYSQLKSDIKLENYLLIENSFEKRHLLTKFRMSDHSLEITTGRYKNITRQQRLYSFCKEIEDEYHFFYSVKEILKLEMLCLKNLKN